MAEENQVQEVQNEPTQQINTEKLSVENVTEIRGLIKEALEVNNSQFTKTIEDNLGTFRGEMEALTKSLSEEKTTAEANLKKYELAIKLREENIDVRFLDFLPLDADPKETEEKINVIKDILDSYAVKILQGDMINNPMKLTSGGIKNGGPTPNQFAKSQFEKMVRE
ncbi:MAG: hypothetical protein ACLT4F_11485 [Clostridia bacterium]